MKIKLKRNEFALAIVVGLLLVGFIVQRAIFQPMLSKAQEKNEEIAAKEKQFARMLRISASNDIIDNKFEDFKAFINVSGAEEDKLAAAMRKIEEIAEKSKISLQDIKPEGAVELELGGKQTKIRIIITGTQQQFLKFVYLLESCDLAFNLAKLDMKVKNVDAGLLDIDTAVSFIYFVE